MTRCLSILFAPFTTPAAPFWKRAGRRDSLAPDARAVPRVLLIAIQQKPIVVFALCTLLLLLAGMPRAVAKPTTEAAKQAAPVVQSQVQPTEEIVATVTGSLTTAWNPDTLHYASVKSSGGEILLDPVGCPLVTRELLEFQRSQGGGIITGVQVRAKGQIVFEARPESTSYREQARDQPDALIPVLRVRWIEITTLPVTQEVGTIQRKRDRVHSTTVRLPNHAS